MLNPLLPNKADNGFCCGVGIGGRYGFRIAFAAKSVGVIPVIGSTIPALGLKVPVDTILFAGGVRPKNPPPAACGIPPIILGVLVPPPAAFIDIKVSSPYF